MNSPAPATVFVIDDDGDVRASIQRLLKTVGVHGEAFASAQEFLRQNMPDGGKAESRLSQIALHVDPSPGTMLALARFA